MRAAHPSLNIRSDARNGARSRQTQLGKRSLVRSRSLITTNNGEQEVRVQLRTGGQRGISRGSPEQVIDGWRYFGYAPRDGERP